MLQISFNRLVASQLILLFVLFVVSTSQAAGAERFTNFLGMKFISIPAGSFKMGADPEGEGVPIDELPQHIVQVPRFQLMTTEVTLAQYKRYIIASNNINIVSDAFMDANAFGDQAPVTYVSWNDVRKFAHWLNRNKSANDKGKYRLPTEAEWEYACRAGTDEPFCGSVNASEVAWYTSKSLANQQAVAQKKSNAFGLYDMSGNVREWVQDCYHQNYENAPSDANAWSKNCSASSRVVRGGAWKDVRYQARSTGRSAMAIPSRTPLVGFRLVRELN